MRTILIDTRLKSRLNSTQYKELVKLCSVVEGYLEREYYSSTERKNNRVIIEIDNHGCIRAILDSWETCKVEYTQLKTFSRWRLIDNEENKKENY